MPPRLVTYEQVDFYSSNPILSAIVQEIYNKCPNPVAVFQVDLRRAEKLKKPVEHFWRRFIPSFVSQVTQNEYFFKPSAEEEEEEGNRIKRFQEMIEEYEALFLPLLKDQR